MAPPSDLAVARAIDLTLENSGRLTFFHVITADFVEYPTIGPLRSVYKELHGISEFMMLRFCDQAQQRGVSEVNYEIRQGNIRQQLRQFVIETEASILVIRTPIRGFGRSIFSAKEIQTFTADLEAEGETHIIVVAPNGQHNHN